MKGRSSWIGVWRVAALAGIAAGLATAGLGAQETGDEAAEAPGALRSAVTEPAPSPAPSAPDPAETEARSEALKTAEENTRLVRRIAQLMMVQLGSQLRPNNDDRIMLRDFPPGGVLIPQVSKPTRAAQYVKELRSLPIEEDEGLPLFIGANVYGLTQAGLIPDPQFVQLPSPLSVAAAGPHGPVPSLATEMARQLKAMGINLHFGPSLALASPLSSARHSVNTFGSDPSIAAETSSVFLKAFREAGLVTVPSGFPGGGANRIDDGPAILLTPRELLPVRAYLPFQQAIADGTRMVHVGPTLVPTLEPDPLAACLSPIVIRHVLKRELAFDGLVVAGPIDDPDVVKDRTPTEAATQALRAGADMLLWTRSGRHLAKVIQDIATAVKRGDFDAKLIDDAYDRIELFKEDINLAEFPPPDESATRNLERKGYKFQEPYQVERRAITLVQNRGNTLPLDEEESMPVGITGVTGVQALHDILKEDFKHIARQPIVSAEHVGRIQRFEIERLTRYARGVKTVVCVFSDTVSGPSQAQVIRAFKELGSRVVVVLLGHPDILPDLTDADAIVLAYASSVDLKQSMRAVTDILMGRGPVKILPPIRDVRQAANTPVTFDVGDVIRTPVGKLPVSIAEPYMAGYSVAYDGDSAVKKTRWQFGDGKKAKGPRVEHTFKQPGTYTVQLTVTDHQDQEQTEFFPVIIE